MRLKIQTEPPETMKSDIREPVQTTKSYDNLDSEVYSVLGMPFGGPYDGFDSDGQTFTANTDAWLSADKEIPVTYYHGFGPDSPSTWQETPAVIGVAKWSRTDERGFWFDVKLDSTETLTSRIIGVKSDKVRASSGAIGHLVRVSDKGEILVWPLGELALFDVNKWRKPANDFAVFEAKAEVTEALVEAETQTMAVDTPPEHLDLKQEINIMEDEKDVKNAPESNAPAAQSVDVDASVSSAINKAIETVNAKWESLLNEKPLNAPVNIKSENLGDPDRNHAFAHYLLSGEKTKGLKAAMGEFTAGVGGYLVPDDYYAGIVEKRNELSIPRRAGATIFQTSRDVFNIPVEATSQTYFAQASHDMAAVSEEEPTVGNIAGQVWPFTKLVKVSQDLLEDNASNLNQFLANSFARWAAMTENRCTLIGAGTTAPQGVTVGGTAALTFDDTNSIAATEIPELYYKLSQAYRDRASWVLNDDTLAFLSGLSSSSVFTFGPHEISENKIMNRAYYTSTYMPKYTTTAYKSIVFGDWSMYALVERRGMTIQRLNELYAGNRQVGLLATFRMGGAVMQAEAFQVGKQA